MAKNILITGSGGFVGSNLKDFLISDYNLFCPRSNELDLTVSGAVKNYFDDKDIDFVIHCATTGGVRDQNDPQNCESTNMSMVYNLIESKKSSTKLIVFGSGAAYEKNRNLHKVKESEIGDVLPADQYGRSKMKIANLAQSREDMLCLNIFACYGKNEKASRFPTYAITQNLNKQPIIINQNVIFDYLYIGDLCRIVKEFLFKKTKHNVINVTPSQSISLFEIAQIVNTLGCFKSKIEFNKQGLNFEYTGDNSTLLDELPDFEFTPYEKGIANLYSYLI